MFGQPSNSLMSPGGTTTASPFGQSTNNNTNSGFGSFGVTSTPRTNNTNGFGFGSPGGFGTNTSGGFGSNNASSSFSFGNNNSNLNSNNNTSSFGRSTTTPFGSPAPAGLFGSSNNTSGFNGFGTNNNSNSITPSGGLFGNNTAQTNTFGSTNNSSTGFGFGASNNTTSNNTQSGGLFGSSNTTLTNTFGGSTTSGFGTSNNSNQMLGSNLFGSSNNNTGGNVFGANQASQQQQSGTSAVPYQGTTNQDGNNDSITLEAITAMQVYSNKSFEELRYEDYLAGNRGSMNSNNSMSMGGFGASNMNNTNNTNNSGFGLFGNNSNNTGQATATSSIFGAPAAAPGNSLFGSPTPATSGFGFNAQAPAPSTGLFGSSGSVFGSTNTNTSNTGLFGQSSNTNNNGAAKPSLFGAAPSPSPSLFGAAPAAPAGGGLFGAPSPAPSGLFGASAAPSTSGGLFGAAPAPASGGLFGAAATGSAAPTSGGLFGNTGASTGGLFGSAPAPASSGGLFGAPSTGLFGTSPAPSGGLFGASAPAPSLFGTPTAAPASTSLFGASSQPAQANTTVAQQQQQQLQLQAYKSDQSASELLLAQQVAAVEAQRKELASLEPWRGNSPSGSNLTPTSLSEREAEAFAAGAGVRTPSFISSAAVLHSHRNSQTKTYTPSRNRDIESGILVLGESNGTNNKEKDRSLILSPDQYLLSSSERFTIQPGSLGKPVVVKKNYRYSIEKYDKFSATNEIEQNGNMSSRSSQHESNTNNIASPTFGSVQSTKTVVSEEKEGAETNENESRRLEYSAKGVETPHDQVKNLVTSDIKGLKESSSSSKKDGYGSIHGSSYDLYQRVIETAGSKTSTTPTVTEQNGIKHDALDSPAKRSASPSRMFVPKLTKKGYTMKPTFDEMSRMSEASLAAVFGFVIEREGYGSVEWDGAVDVRDVDIDSVVTIQRREVIIYENEEIDGTKPPIGSKLNRPAVITLQGMVPADNNVEKYRHKLERSTRKMGAEFISYDPIHGTWKFRTQHFSRYGLLEDEEDDDDDDPILTESSKNLPLYAGAGFPSTPDQRTDIAMVSDDCDETFDDFAVQQAAENAYRSLLMMQTGSFDNPAKIDGVMIKEQNTDSPHFENFSDSTTIPFKNVLLPKMHTILKPSAPDVSNAFTCLRNKEKEGICAHTAKKFMLVETKASSVATDFSLRMKKSFRVAWKPDGSFLYPSSIEKKESKKTFNMTLHQRRLSFQKYSEDFSLTKVLLKTHIKHSVRKSFSSIDHALYCPMYELPVILDSSEGSKNPYKLLCNAMEDYIAAIKENVSNVEVNKAGKFDHELLRVPLRAMELMCVLYGQERHWSALPTDNEEKQKGSSVIANFLPDNEALSTIFSGAYTEEQIQFALNRRYGGFVSWLRLALSYDVDCDTTEEALDPLKCIFVALSGGNIEKACDIASKYGYWRLSLLMSSSVAATGPAVSTQMKLWHHDGPLSDMPLSLTRIYALLCGDLEVEKRVYEHGDSVVKNSIDWRRRLGMKVWCHNSDEEEVRTETSFASLIREYDQELSDGLAPLPFPRYIQNHIGSNHTNYGKNITCTLYQLMRLHAYGQYKKDKPFRSLSQIVSPLGHTPSNHDYSLTFHLTALLRALRCSSELTRKENLILTDGFVAMLVHHGRWEWGLYVILCSEVDPDDEASRNHVQGKAKSFFLRYFICSCKNELDHKQACSFLREVVGVPDSWFEEALAIQCANDNDAMGYVSHCIASMQHDEAILVTELVILPEALLMGGKNASKIKCFLELMVKEGLNNMSLWNEDNGCGAILHLLELSDHVGDLLRLSKTRLNGKASDIEFLTQKMKHLRNRIVDFTTTQSTERENASLIAYERKKNLIQNYKFMTLKEEQIGIYTAQLVSQLNKVDMQLKMLCNVIESCMTINADEIDHDEKGRDMTLGMMKSCGSQLAFVTYCRNEGLRSVSASGLDSKMILRGVTGKYSSNI